MKFGGRGRGRGDNKGRGGNRGRGGKNWCVNTAFNL